MSELTLQQIEELLDRKLDQKLKNLATKEDLKLAIDDVIAHIVSSTDHAKADKTEVQLLEKRVTRIEKTINLH